MFDKVLIGWREWISLPELGITAIRAKADTGARTSALHAFNIYTFQTDSGLWVHFQTHPLEHQHDVVVSSQAPLIGTKVISDSGGHREERYVINTLLKIGHSQWNIELTLTARHDMQFKMLLGRTAMQGRLCVDPSASYLLGKHAKYSFMKTRRTN
ncbi:MAG: hypothetical protein RIT27_2133 [Pseudomonadota bacterium]|jgi:hypothetical protein